MMLLSSGLLLVTSSGCSMLVKQTYHAVKGASGRYYEVEVVDAEALAEYGSIRFEPFTNALGGHVPDELIAAIHERMPAEVEKADLFDGSDGPAVVVNGQIIHYNGRSGLKGALQSVMGVQECVCRVQLSDGDTGRRIGEAVCWSEVKSAVRRGAGELGEGVGKGMVKWLEDRLRPDEPTTDHTDTHR
ncbi:MAG: hypothetical protein C4547_05725 [Phycisphaerales bacterium]|nr:MAG: hypothetical protein C4547_05725 [Phycisphaerales bacterium]